MHPSALRLMQENGIKSAELSEGLRNDARLLQLWDEYIWLLNVFNIDTSRGSLHDPQFLRVKDLEHAMLVRLEELAKEHPATESQKHVS